MKLMDIDTEHLGIPESEYKAIEICHHQSFLVFAKILVLLMTQV